MTTRRRFLTSLLAASAIPTLTWADAGSPDWLAAAREPDGGFALFGMTDAGEERFRIPLPGRGHAATAHPERPEAVAFARRPGTFALVLDCVTGEVLRRLDTPAGHHFYGHGCFSRDGSVLYTTENHIESGEGRIGLWDRSAGYARIGAVASGGIGPHELRRLPGRDDLVIANGGILTHPDHGRDKLNIDTMQPNLGYLSMDGTLLDTLTLDAELNQNSIRHLALRADGLVAFAMQWEGTQGAALPLVGLHRRGADPVLATATEAEQLSTKGYAGSIAFDASGAQVAITAPRGGKVHVFDAEGQFVQAHVRPDVCGIGPSGAGFVVTDGFGGVGRILDSFTATKSLDRAWDNHLVAL
ncbi:DUF1513 domain-containing protein [Puniceibacterium sp. IMCC21224]|uniref:DUF1513 domain-containing protein n=1 Tax=Puniceibacterium sp. IMCC21224 TaxID=1618204 RepID=UPI00064DFA9B|nr:DUF1513 domain-containing protein [Puniceibacterium sp. IMCC21224]KMK65217.1 hypothetical protein IMCC21224_1147 [Puniceibacterium sp. IMCC21224]